MGSPKQLLKVEGVPLLRRAVATAISANPAHVIAVVGANEELLRPILDGMEIEVAVNADWQTGMASSIRCGINQLMAVAPDCDGVLVMLADQPLITGQSLNKILKAREEYGAGIVAARYKGGLGTPAFFPREYFESLLKLDGSGGAKKLLEGLGDRVLALDLPEAAEDIDTPEDYAAFISVENLKPYDATQLPGQTRRQFMTHVTVAGAGVLALPGLIQTLRAAEPPSLAPVASAKNMTTIPVRLLINGTEQTLHLDPRVTLLDALREKLGLTGTKKGCDQGQCGSCTVLVNGRRINSCLALAVVHDGDAITTIEGLAHGDELHPVQKAFLEHDGFQCGYCTPGQICSAVALIKEGHAGSDDEIREWMSGNICRCGAYPNIIAAIREVNANQTGAI